MAPFAYGACQWNECLRWGEPTNRRSAQWAPSRGRRSHIGHPGRERRFQMRTRYAVALAVVIGFGLGAVTAQTLHAQAKPPIYYIAETDVTNLDAYTKEYAPKAQALIKASGGRLLAAGQKVTSIEGQPAKPRVAVQVWD